MFDNNALSQILKECVFPDDIENEDVGEMYFIGNQDIEYCVEELVYE